MKVFGVCGIKQSGKTTTIQRIITELCSRGYRVGSVKDIHFEAFAIDPLPTSNTRRHREAGAGLVTARGLTETDLLFPSQLSFDRILDFYEGAYDYVVIEGASDFPVPCIVTAHNWEDLAQKFSGFTFCVSGRIAANIEEYKKIPAINALTDITALVDLIERKVYERLPRFEPQCCGACGQTCEEFALAVLHGEAKRSDCVADKGISLIVGGKRLKMVPFVQKLLKNAVLGVVSELNGYEKDTEIRIAIGSENGVTV